MKIALALFEYFPYGGLQRDFLSVAIQLRDRGHDVVIFVSEWLGERLEGVQYVRIRRHGVSNHARSLSFSRKFEKQSREKFDVRIGFNRMLGLDYYFAADPCYAAWHAPEEWRRWLPRYRAYLALERDLIEGSQTRLFYLSPQQKQDYQACYSIADERFILVPPGIDPHYRLNAAGDPEWRTQHRQSLGLEESDHVLLHVGSNFRLKGLERVINAMAGLPDRFRETTHLLVIGQDNIRPFQHRAMELGLSQRVHFLGARDDVHEWMRAADVLVHPSDYESAGMVIVEAIASGVPAVVTSSCGYAFHVEASEMGLVIPMPFDGEILVDAIRRMLKQRGQTDWHQKAKLYQAKVDLYGLADSIVSEVESYTG